MLPNLQQRLPVGKSISNVLGATGGNASIILTKNDWYEEYEMGWAGEWNPKMVNVYKSLGATQSRRMVTYRYWFNREHPFEKHPVMEYK